MVSSKETGRGGAAHFAWLDYLKGIAIFCVVFNHTMLGLVNNGLIESTVIWQVWRGIVYSFSMPTFFFIAGMFLPRFLNRPMKDFWIDRLTSVVYPYVVWVVLFTFIHALVPEEKTTFESNLAGTWRLIFRGPWHYWFLYCLLWTSIYYIVLRRLGVGPAAMIGVAAALFLMTNLSLAVWAGPLFPERYVEVMSRWTPYHWQGLYLPSDNMLFVALGAYVGRDNLKARVGHMSTPRLAAVSLAGFSALAVWSYFGVREAELARPAAAALGGSAAICAAVVLERKKWPGFLEHWGRRSLEIYLAHVIFLSAVRILLHRYLNFEIGFVHLALGVAAGIYGSIALYYACARIHLLYLFSLKKRAATSATAGRSSTGSATSPRG